MVGNYYKPGPATAPDKRAELVDPSKRSEEDKGQWFVGGNFVEGNSLVTEDNWSGVRGDNYIKLAKPWDSMPIQYETAQEAYKSVLDQAGAVLPKRDAIDARIIHEARSGIATFEGVYKTIKPVLDKSKITGIIDSQNDVGGWPELKSSPAPKDTDHDGMPDVWEIAKGLDPENPDDRNKVGEAGYTMLEVYLNGIE